MTPLRHGMSRLAVRFAALTAFLLPLKFGGLAGVPELSSFYPPGVSDWLVVSWPVQFFPVVSGTALLLALAGGAWRPPADVGVRLLMALWGFLLPAAALWGMRSSAVADYAHAQIVHFAGIGAAVWCFGLLIAAEPRARNILFGALMWGSLCAVLLGWYQYLWGFEETRRFFAEAAAAGATEVSEQLRIKLNDDRVYATFSSCNTFAGFLLLTGAALAGYFGTLGDRFEPRRFSRLFFGGVAALLALGLLFLTRSRGALLCALLAGAGFVLTSRLSRAVKFVAAGVALALLVGGAVYVRCAGRGFSSSGERLDYLVTTARLVAEHPLSGSGWDGFFREHMRSKISATDEAAHDPHNFAAAFAAAGGVPAGLVALAALACPFVLIYRRRKESDPLRRAVFWGCAAFALHMLMEVDHLTPAAPTAFMLLALFILIPEDAASPAPSPTERVICSAAAVTLALAALGSGSCALSGDVAYARFCSVVEPEPGMRWRPPSPARLEAALAEVLKARPGSPFPLEKAADCYVLLGMPERAEELLKEALLTGGPRPGPFWKLAAIAEIRGRRSEAEAHRAEAERLFPAKYRPLRRSGR